jgi:ankyrin repeat protein
MKRAIWYLVLVLSLSLFLVSGVWAGEFEDKLLQTAGSCNINVMQDMLEKGADVNASNKVQKIALMISSEQGCTSCVRLLLDKGANVNARDNLGRTALMMAAMHGREDIVCALLDKGADVNVRETGFPQYTALGYAKESENKKVIEILKAAGAKE